MKRILLIIAALVIPAFAHAQWQVAPGAGTPRALNTPGTVMERANVDIYGNQMVTFGVSGTPIPVNPAQIEMTPAPMITILPTALPTAFGTPQFANTAGLKTVTVDNGNGDAEIWCAYGGLTAASFRVLPGKSYTDNLGARGNIMSGAIGCIHSAATPSTGTIAIYGSK